MENVHILTQLQCRESASSGVARGELGRREFWRSAATSPAYPGCDVANLRQLNGAGGNGIWAFPRGRSSARDSAVQCEESLSVDRFSLLIHHKNHKKDKIVDILKGKPVDSLSGIGQLNL